MMNKSSDHKKFKPRAFKPKTLESEAFESKTLKSKVLEPRTLEPRTLESKSRNTAYHKLESAFNVGSFVKRHVGLRPPDVESMLEAIGCETLDELIDETMPADIRSHELPPIGDPLSEIDALRSLRQYAFRNRLTRSFIGQGYANCVTPTAIRRSVLENPSWYTAYTPYQAEISQGRLEALLNFQTMVSDLSAMPVANASLLDEATAAAEAMLLSKRVAKDKKARRYAVASTMFPQTIDVLLTRAEPLDIDIVLFHPDKGLPEDSARADSGFFGCMVGYPDGDGAVRDHSALIDFCRQRGLTLAVGSDLLALCVLKPPGELGSEIKGQKGADIVFGSTQRFGVPMFFGGPHAAFFAVSEPLKRQIPGRIIGLSRDRRGTFSYRMALQTREQHIRREKATSNICTAQTLLAVVAMFYACWHNPRGLARIARHAHHYAKSFADFLKSHGLEVLNDTAFDTLTIRVDHAKRIHAAAGVRNYEIRAIDDHTVGLSFDETTKPDDLDVLAQIFVPKNDPRDNNWEASDAESRSLEDSMIPQKLIRTTPPLKHGIFSKYASETALVRYMRRLADRDLALDKAMIPLGSCTMKLNAAAELEPILWDAFATVHPFAPEAHSEGLRLMIDDLCAKLAQLTGFDMVSVQPNAGSQGEYAGMLAIRRYHVANNQEQRNTCLIPVSAHGTNPSSAAMAGLAIVEVECTQSGDIDVDDLRAKAERYKDSLAAFMITYPSTHGVFESRIVEICDIVHQFGGQVYMDGANLNAQLGLTSPGLIGADVAHLNLHKTFCIPHGGGGPGVGPIGVKRHLTPYLPGHGDGSSFSHRHRAVSAARYGSAGILPISWMYIAMMGAQGLTVATQTAILSANYVAKRLEQYYPVLYVGEHGRVAHECIVDLRGFKESAGIDVEDVAKRLIDYGFHAPTMSFPVPGTLMIEPTESESKVEIDRFIEAMIQIRAEIKAVEDGLYPREDNVLVKAPHVAEEAICGEWTHPYSREQALFPSGSGVNGVAGMCDKYWPPVARVDNVQGDRHLVCRMPPLEVFEEAWQARHGSRSGLGAGGKRDEAA